MRKWVENLSGLRIPTLIDPREYGVDLAHDRPIDTSESSVYRGKTKVVKVYDGFMSHLIDWWVLCRYSQLTKTVGRLIDDSFQAELIFGCPISVIPIKRIGVTVKRSSLCSVSEYVEGENVNQLNLRGSDLTAMICRFARLNEFLQNQTGEPAVRIDFTNAKFRNNNRRLIVTDVCGEVARLNPGYDSQPAMFG